MLLVITKGKNKKKKETISFNLIKIILEKINKSDFEEQFEIFFSSEQTLNSGTSKVLFNQKQAFLKDKETGEVIPTDVFANSEELGEAMVIERYCIPD